MADINGTRLDRHIRDLLEAYQKDHKTPHTVKKTTTTLQNLGMMSADDDIVLVTVPTVVQQLEGISCVGVSSIKQMKALVHIKENYGYEGLYTLVGNVVNATAIANLTAKKGISFNDGAVVVEALPPPGRQRFSTEDEELKFLR